MTMLLKWVHLHDGVTTLYGFFKDFIYLFLDRGEGREKEREINVKVWLLLMHPLLGTWLITWACALNGNRIGNPLVHRRALNPLSHTSQDYPVHFIVKEIKAWCSVSH